MASEVLLTIKNVPGNDKCADCASSDPTMAEYHLGILLCETCAKLHKDLIPESCKIRLIDATEWSSEEVEVLRKMGNLNSNASYEKMLPPCHQRPKRGDPPVLFEQWILGKYVRKEFCGPNRPAYLIGHKEGYLWKRGKEDKHFNKRRFVLDAKENKLKYYNKEGVTVPKAVLEINEINAILSPDKVGHPNGLQLLFLQNEDIRSIFLYADSGKDLIDWYMCLRAAKLNFLGVANPSSSTEELLPMLCTGFLKEGWLNKAGPNPGDGFKRRWVSLDKHNLLYYKDAMSPFAQGEVYFDSRDKSYSVSEGIDFLTVANSFTLRTPGRVFHFSAESDSIRKEWIEALSFVITTALPIRRRITRRKSSIRDSILAGFSK